MPPNSESTIGCSACALLLEHQQPPARALALEQPRQHLVGVVAPRDALGLVVVVVDADDVGRDALPAVVADHRPRRVERLGQVIERLHVVPLAPGCRAGSGTPHDSLNGTQATMHGWL